MKFISAFFFLICVYTSGICQEDVSSTQLHGVWISKVVESKSEGTRLMFNDAELILTEHKAFSFTPQNFKGFTGSWAIRQDEAVLTSSDTPAPIILTEIAQDSCVWNFREMKAKIVFYRKNADR